MPRRTALDKENEVLALYQQQLPLKEISGRTGVCESTIMGLARRAGLERRKIVRHAADVSKLRARKGRRGNLRRLSNGARFAKVRDLEHFCRCYVNAYVMQLEGRTGGVGGDQSPQTLQERMWGVLIDLMFGVLLQEGVIEKMEG